MGTNFVYAGATPITVHNISDEPIVAADSVPGYGPIFNAGVIHHDGRFHLFARGVRAGYRRNGTPGDRFLNYISDVLVFTSSDGRRYEFQHVLAAASRVHPSWVRHIGRAGNLHRDRNVFIRG